MKYVVNLNSVTPVRSAPQEQAEMVTQLLFGETCEVEGDSESFVKIKNSIDSYTGWVDAKMLTEIDEEIYTKLLSHPTFMTCVPIADAFCMTDKSIYHLSAGSRLPFYNPENSSFDIAGKTFQIHPSFVTYLPHSSKDNIIATAMLFLNSPYMWGGKNVFGIDCSGLVQTVFAMNGFSLTRDAGTQVKEGEIISSLAEAQPTDLLFFEKDEKTTHVGIYLGDGKIIHASGKVKIEPVDNKGIMNDETSAYSHILSAIRRI
ncbi:C40 family peptidase [Dysgonomonas sp. 520]|uniref:C40 family peptidase n=1 Tax=Dysgonomonas sp. 520 TaxID=2302931 RepID=UPI0013CFCE68|nr:C40 family peptidase [Dysgonomonas sp. 520]